MKVGGLKPSQSGAGLGAGAEPTATDRRHALDSFNTAFPPNLPEKDGSNNGVPGRQAPNLPKISSAHGNIGCENDKNPDPTIPPEIFNFDLILNGRKFRVLCDTLLRINTEEDLAEYSEAKLNWCLEQCASYRMTCFCAYVAAHREKKRWEGYFKTWLAEKRTEARNALRLERMAEKVRRDRKEIGQITKEEVDDWILVNYGSEYHGNEQLVSDWREHMEVFLELRDTLKDRGTHLQTILRRVQDHIAPRTSDGSPIA